MATVPCNVVSWHTAASTYHQLITSSLCVTVSCGAAINSVIYYEMPILLAVDQTFGLNSKMIILYMVCLCRSKWPCGLRRRSAAARLLRSWVRIPLGAWMFVVNVVCCQVEFSASSWSLVQRSPTDCGASCVWYRNLINEEAMALWGLLCQRKKNGLSLMNSYWTKIMCREVQ